VGAPKKSRPELRSVVTPLCFDSHAQYRQWRTLADVCSTQEKWAVLKHGFCVDCTPEYQQEMLGAKRCQHPETIFQEGPHGEKVGRRDKKQHIAVCATTPEVERDRGGDSLEPPSLMDFYASGRA